ncbi:hypothetical protein [Candidatus Hydrogenosomobacter endosymbioticus]|uniref:Uncharacterized protein n=1 Tax=Candidatus Hydrogenosomobacter endosymbioticus TaxID=2558174 RepID=A0ABN6L320_9PROT|nr:hypothetical protein [Candidatus Hydrogenosomobacter endosymbioticus]BDB96304.1 hypothetical protein HYD_4370 [Candidatus Hydrogenosomobacter endosymbioticus]
MKKILLITVLAAVASVGASVNAAQKNNPGGKVAPGIQAPKLQMNNAAIQQPKQGNLPQAEAPESEGQDDDDDDAPAPGAPMAQVMQRPGVVVPIGQRPPMNLSPGLSPMPGLMSRMGPPPLGQPPMIGGGFATSPGNVDPSQFSNIAKKIEFCQQLLSPSPSLMGAQQH